MKLAKKNALLLAFGGVDLRGGEVNRGVCLDSENNWLF